MKGRVEGGAVESLLEGLNKGGFGRPARVEMARTGIVSVVSRDCPGGPKVFLRG